MWIQRICELSTAQTFENVLYRVMWCVCHVVACGRRWAVWRMSLVGSIRVPRCSRPHWLRCAEAIISLMLPRGFLSTEERGGERGRGRKAPWLARNTRVDYMCHEICKLEKEMRKRWTWPTSASHPPFQGVAQACLWVRDLRTDWGCSAQVKQSFIMTQPALRRERLYPFSFIRGWQVLLGCIMCPYGVVHVPVRFPLHWFVDSIISMSTASGSCAIRMYAECTEKPPPCSFDRAG